MVYIPVNEKLKREIAMGPQKLQVYAENIAQVDTPNVKAKMIDPKALKGQNSGFSRQLKMARTSPNHIAHVTTTQTMMPRVIEDKSKTHMKPNGNNINATENYEKMAEETFNFSQASALFRKHQDMLRSVVRK